MFTSPTQTAKRSEAQAVVEAQLEEIQNAWNHHFGS